MDQSAALFTACSLWLGISVPCPTIEDHTVALPSADDVSLQEPLTHTTTIDLSKFSDQAGIEHIEFDLNVPLRSISKGQLVEEPDWAVGVRLLLGEMGPDRLVTNELAVWEGIAILETVSNRLDEEVWNPLHMDDVRAWPGCGPDASFAACAHPDQYLGLQHRHALRPRSTRWSEDTLTAAVEVAVTAWWLHHEAVVEQLTLGATSFVHRCGGAAYGRPTTYCDGEPSVPDVEGAHGHTGPLVLKGPKTFLEARGHYALQVTTTIDYRPRAAIAAFVGTR